jgi:asparagine synthase (glutamine-hydrolysing)
MCGIVAAYSAGGAAIEPARLHRAMDALVHRGPDGAGAWFSEDGAVALGHRRLSIIDLATGQQPIGNEDGRIQAVVNGEFYGFQKIRADLEARGHRLKTKSDSEILVHLYEEMGVEALRELRGEFAFVLWDGRQKQIFAARDRFGIKPLYVAQFGGAWWFASEVKALFAAGLPAQWDHESVFFDLQFCQEEGRSLFRGVEQIPPGGLMLINAHGARQRRYWDWNYPKEAARAKRNPQEDVERLRELLAESVKLRLHADVPVGVYLSGGLDSSAILGLAATQRTDKIEAFTIAFENGEFNELDLAERTAKTVGVNLHAFRMTEDVLADHYADAICSAEAFTVNMNNCAKYLLSRKVRDAGMKVVLTGEGSDEIFGGYPYLARDQMLYGASGEGREEREARLTALIGGNKIWSAMMSRDPAALSLEAIARINGHVPTFFENQAGRGGKMREFLRPGFLKKFEGLDPMLAAMDRLDYAGQIAGRAPLDQAMYIWAHTYFPSKLLNWLGDRSEMAHSVEGRVPFLDHHLVEAVVQMAPEVKVRGTTEKWVLREAAKPYVTPEIYGRAKFPFFGPPELKGEIWTMMQDVFASKMLEDQPFFDPEIVRLVVGFVPAIDDSTLKSRIFVGLHSVLSACVLQERFRVGV